jgi:ADP-ribose pyrophosphatase
LEIPAGKLEAAEKPLDCAIREFAEETGFEAEKWTELFAFYPSPGFCDEVIYLFKAEKLKAAIAPGSDPDENIDVVKVPLGKTTKMIDEGLIKDGKTIIALQYYLLKEKRT